jgi:hypothetical protein
MRAWVVAVAMTGVAHASPDSIALDASEDLGLISASHEMLNVSVEHRWANRAFAELRAAAGTGDDLRWYEVRAGGGLVLHTSRRVDLSIGWRIGDTYVSGAFGSEPYKINLLGVDLILRLSVDVGCGWRVRMTPLSPMLYWHHTYGGALALELGVEHAL